MRFCPFTLNADGLWQCPDCGWIYKRKAEKSPRRNCPKKLTPEQLAQREAARAEQEEAAKHGPGTQLHKLITKFTGEKITASCGCKSHIAEMNRNGPAWCRENVDTIIGWMEEEIERRLKEAEAAKQKVEELQPTITEIQKRIDNLCTGKTCGFGRKKYTQRLDELKQQLAQAEQKSKPGWRLKLAGYKLPGQRLAIKRVILLACTLAERAERPSAILH